MDNGYSKVTLQQEKYFSIWSPIFSHMRESLTPNPHLASCVICYVVNIKIQSLPLCPPNRLEECRALISAEIDSIEVI